MPFIGYRAVEFDSIGALIVDCKVNTYYSDLQYVKFDLMISLLITYPSGFH